MYHKKQKSSLGLVMALMLMVPVFALDESSDYRNTYISNVTPFLDNFEESHFYGVDNKRIEYAKLEVENEVGAIVVLTGMSESYVKYGELMYDLRDMGYSFYAMDHRGFGRSQRLLSDQKKNYVCQFGDYIEDVKSFMDHVVKAKPHKKIFLIAHSMGGGIAANYLERYPYDFTGAVLCSPMLQVNTGDLPAFVAYPTLSFLNSIGLGQIYAPGHEANSVPVPFDQNKVTHSPLRHEIFNGYLAGRYTELYYGCQVQGDTVRFCKEMMDGTYVAQMNVWKVKTPVLMFQAGQDLYVKPTGQNAWAAHSGNCTIIKFPTAKHEILMETDDIRDMAVNAIMNFIETH